MFALSDYFVVIPEELALRLEGTGVKTGFWLRTFIMSAGRAVQAYAIILRRNPEGRTFEEIVEGARVRRPHRTRVAG